MDNKPNTSTIVDHAIRLTPGQALYQEIKQYINKNNIQAGFIMTCVGSLQQTNIRLANATDFMKTNKHYEITSLVGCVSCNERIHLHISSQDMTNKDRWTFGLPISQLLDPTQYMGFPNTYGITVIYNGTPMPPTPPTPIFRKNNKFKWILYARKLRSKNLFIN